MEKELIRDAEASAETHITPVLVVFQSLIAEPRDCKEHYRNGARHRGVYTVQSDQGGLSVYCDMLSEAGYIWTLVMSYSLDNVTNHPSKFQTTPLYVDSPFQEDTPNWSGYRMSKNQMKWIEGRSTIWRITCSFEQSYKIDHRDYIRAALTSLNPILFYGYNKCRKVRPSHFNPIYN